MRECSRVGRGQKEVVTRPECAVMLATTRQGCVCRVSNVCLFISTRRLQLTINAVGGRTQSVVLAAAVGGHIFYDSLLAIESCTCMICSLYSVLM